MKKNVLYFLPRRLSVFWQHSSVIAIYLGERTPEAGILK